MAPEADAEVVDGVVLETMGSNSPHAVQHATITRVFGGCLSDGYEAAVDMLTRINKKNDFAADVSVFPTARTAAGQRKLEEIVFEVCDSEDEAHVTDKARKFAKRGVRRVFHVRVETRAVAEWSRSTEAWVPLGEADEIRDRCFVVAMPVAALVDRLRADDTVARALVARRNPVIEAIRREERDEGHREGHKAGKDEAFRVMLQVMQGLGRPLDAVEIERLSARLDALGAARALTETATLRAEALLAWLAQDAPR